MSIEMIEKRIADERARVDQAESERSQLESKRRLALESGDNSALDRIDAELRDSGTSIGRGNELVEILKKKHQEAILAQRDAGLDALAAKADRARVAGETLIARYGSHASAISELLGKLQVAEEFIFESNRTLSAAGRPATISPNTIRCRPTTHGSRVERRG
jgi:hypothetical protein